MYIWDDGNHERKNIPEEVKQGKPHRTAQIFSAERKMKSLHANRILSPTQIYLSSKLEIEVTKTLKSMNNLVFVNNSARIFSFCYTMFAEPKQFVSDS